MRFLPFVLKHLRTTWLRTASTVVAMALCVFLFCTLQSVLAHFGGYVSSRSPRRLITRNAVSLIRTIGIWIGKRSFPVRLAPARAALKTPRADEAHIRLRRDVASRWLLRLSPTAMARCLSPTAPA
jgi:hypothetical protein